MGRAQPHTLSHLLRYYTRHNSSQTACRTYLNIKFLTYNLNIILKVKYD